MAPNRGAQVQHHVRASSPWLMSCCAYRRYAGQPATSSLEWGLMGVDCTLGAYSVTLRHRARQGLGGRRPPGQWFAARSLHGAHSSTGLRASKVCAHVPPSRSAAPHGTAQARAHVYIRPAVANMLPLDHIGSYWIMATWTVHCGDPRTGSTTILSTPVGRAHQQFNDQE